MIYLSDPELLGTKDKAVFRGFVVKVSRERGVASPILGFAVGDSVRLREWDKEYT